jgi:hypothetical protein
VVTDLTADAAVKAMQAQLPEATSAAAAGGGLLAGLATRALGPLGFYFGSTEPANAGEKPFGKDWLTGPGLPNWAPRHFSTADIRAAVGFPHFSTDDIRAAVGGHAAEVKGSADLNVNVQVEPSDSFISRIISALHNEINAFTGGGSAPGTGVGTVGSTGLSMPEAVPPR